MSLSVWSERTLKNRHLCRSTFIGLATVSNLNMLQGDLP